MVTNGVARMSRLVISPGKTIVYSFFLGGLLALVAQMLLALWQATLMGTPLEFFAGGATLVSLGVIGCVLGGTGIYQVLQKWATFGALLPFSGFAMAVGMKAIHDWTREEASSRKCVWDCVWFVLWFNVLFAVISILLGAICGLAGIGEPSWTTQKVTDSAVFYHAFVVGGVMSALFQGVFLVAKKRFEKCTALHILMIVWMCGAVFIPCGLSGFLYNWGGEGFAAMATVGGYNMFNVGVDFVTGQTSTALLHLGSFSLTVAGLGVCSIFTWFLYSCLYGRTTLSDVHYRRTCRMAKNIKVDAALILKAVDEQGE